MPGPERDWVRGMSETFVSFGEQGAQLTYGSYLRLPQLLDSQHLESDPPAHDEVGLRQDQGTGSTSTEVLPTAATVAGPRMPWRRMRLRIVVGGQETARAVASMLPA